MKSPTLTSFAYALVFLGQAFGVSSGFLAQAGDLNFGLPNFEAPRDVPSLNLSSLPSADFTILSHPMFPQHSVRIKRSHFCDPTVNVFTGYLDFQARHLFFYFFESRNDPSSDPLLMWINGGPGASSSLGLFMELGPCTVTSKSTSDNGTTWNPYSWNEKTNIFFLDQPVGVGFSYADFGLPISTTEEAAKDVYAFIFLFLEHFKSFKGRALHLSGESYGGRYIPVFASEIVDQNKRALKAGLEPINLQSIMIGNGMTNFETLPESYYKLQCTNTSVPPILDIATCVRIRTALPRCQAAIKRECIERWDMIGCQAAAMFCSTEIEEPFLRTGINPYDISTPCDGTIETTLCYPISIKIAKFLNQPDVRKALGVSQNVGEFSPASWVINSAFWQAGDWLHPTQYYVAGLLERGIDVLIYAGSYDWICNWISNLAWTEKMEWTGAASYNSVELSDWNIDGKKAGITRTSGGLTFATVEGAGHMVPHDKPAEALEMIHRWLSQRSM